ncbi:MAG: hypothetical protein ACTJLK_03595 [Anaplasma sp.]
MLHFLFFNKSESNSALMFNDTNNATEPNVNYGGNSEAVKAALWMSGICLALVAYIYICRCCFERDARRPHAVGRAPRATLFEVESPFNEHDLSHSRSFGTHRVSAYPRGS